MVAVAHENSFHRYGDSDPVPDRARVADSVSIAACSCGMVCIRFHHPATTTHPGRIFAAAFLNRKDCANVGDEMLKALDFFRNTIQCDGTH